MYILCEMFGSNNLTEINGNTFAVIVLLISTLVTSFVTFYFAKRYSSSYHIKSPLKGREKYLVLEKFSFDTKNIKKDIARIILAKSSFKMD